MKRVLKIFFNILCRYFFNCKPKDCNRKDVVDINPLLDIVKLIARKKMQSKILILLPLLGKRKHAPYLYLKPPTDLT